MRCLPYLFAFAFLPGISPAAHAQMAAPLPYTTYTYTGYTVYDTTNPDEPTVVPGVGGSLILRPDGSYEKHMSITMAGRANYFNQAGRFVINGDSIRFSFTDQKGKDVQRGTYQFNPTDKNLTISILGYPEGNKGVYELVAAAPKANSTPAKPSQKPSKKRRR